MGKKLGMMTLALAAMAVASASRSNAGTEMVIDNSAQAPPPAYRYVQPPVVYYAPPPPRVVVYAPPLVSVYGYHRAYVRHGHWHPRWH